MLVTFLKYGAGSGESAANYLVRKQDHKGLDRAEVRVLRGDPHAVAAVADSLHFVHRYSSAVIAFAPEDNPSDEQIYAVLDDFEKLAWPGMDPERYAWAAVLHRDQGGGVHVHIFSARVDLATGKSLNIAPPGWQKDFDALRDSWNHSMGWARPDDPLRARILQPGHKAYIDAARLRQGLQIEPDTRQLITEYLVARIENGSVRDRDGIVAALHEAGLETPRRGKDYITVLDRESGVRCRLKGAIYEQSWTVGRAIEIADRRRTEPARRVDAQAAHRARESFEAAVTRRAAYNGKRYPAVEKARPDQMAASPEHRTGDLHGYLAGMLGADAIPGPSDYVPTAGDSDHGAAPECPEAKGRGDSLRSLRWQDLRSDRGGRADLYGRVPNPAVKEENDDRIGTETDRDIARIDQWVDQTLGRAGDASAVLALAHQQAERAHRRLGGQDRLSDAIAEIIASLERTRSAVAEQLKAMDCPTFEIQVDTPGRDKLFSLWDARQILGKVGWLKARNTQGAVIGIRPAPESKSALALLEVQPSRLPRMRNDGFDLALAVRVTPDISQAWVRLASKDNTIPATICWAAGRILAERYGTENCDTCKNSFGRLAGFKNWQSNFSSHGVFQCRLDISEGQEARLSAWLIMQARQRLLLVIEQMRELVLREVLDRQIRDSQLMNIQWHGQILDMLRERLGRDFHQSLADRIIKEISSQPASGFSFKN